MNLSIVKSKLAPHNKNVLWFDTNNNTLKIYDNGWKSVLKEVVREILNENTEKIVSDIVSEFQKGVQMSGSDFALKGSTGSVKFNKTTAAITYDVENTDSSGYVYDTTTKISPVELSTSIKASNGKSAYFKVGSDSIKALATAGMTFEPKNTFKVNAGKVEVLSGGSVKITAESGISLNPGDGAFEVKVDNGQGDLSSLKFKEDGFDLSVHGDKGELTTRIQVSHSALRLKGTGDINIDDKKRLYINAVEGGAIRITGFGEYDATGETYKEIHPNIHYRFGEVDELEVVLAEPSTGNYKKEYSFEFTALRNNSNIKLPAGVLWETPFEIKERTLYQIKILNNVGTINSYYIPTMEERYMYFYSNEADAGISYSERIEYLIEGEIVWNSGRYFTIPAGKKVYVKNGIRSDTGSLGRFYGDNFYGIGGNIRSLYWGDSAYNAPPKTYESYSELFRDDLCLTSASKLHFGGDTIGLMGCYWMFYGCYNLLYAPKRLPSILLDESCYDGMFYGCYHLLTVPELPATKLTKDCYRQMFYGCGDITEAPELPATELAEGCYSEMFRNCFELVYVKALFKERLSGSDTYWWMYNVASSGTFVKSADATWDEVGYNGVPEGWTVTEEVIEESIESLSLKVNSLQKSIRHPLPQEYFNILHLPLSTPLYFKAIENTTVKVLVGHYLESMFNAEYSINSLETWTSWDGSTINLSAGDIMYVRGNNPNGINSLVSVGFGDPPDNCRVFKFSGKVEAHGNIMSLILAENFENVLTVPEGSFPYLFRNCTTLLTAPALPALNLSMHCYEGMFYGCTSLTEAPELPAINLPYYCYTRMFVGCNLLRSIKIMAKDILYPYSVYNLLNNVTTNGVLYKPSSLVWPEEYPIPSTWTILDYDIPTNNFNNLRKLINNSTNLIDTYTKLEIDNLLSSITSTLNTEI